MKVLLWSEIISRGFFQVPMLVNSDTEDTRVEVIQETTIFLEVCAVCTVWFHSVDPFD